MHLKDFGTLCVFAAACAVLSFSPVEVAAAEAHDEIAKTGHGSHHGGHRHGNRSYNRGYGYRGGHGGDHGDWRRNTGIYYYNGGPYYNNGYYNNPYYDPYYYDDGVYYDNNSGLFFRFGF